MWLAMSEQIVTVWELVERPDGTIGIGNSMDVPVSEAIELIRQEQAISGGTPRGVVPDEWNEG